MMPSFKPSLRGLYTLLLTVFQIVSSGVRVFAVKGLRAGVVDVRPLSRAVRVLVVVALGIIGLFLLSLLFGDGLRAALPLQPIRLGSSGQRALTVPALATPITLITVVLAWSYVLTGAIYMRAGLRWVTFVVYLLFGVLAFTNGMNNIAGIGVVNVLAALGPIASVVLALVLLVVAVLLLPRLRISYAMTFCIMLGLNLLLVLPSLWSTVYLAQTAPDVPFHTADMLNETLQVTRALLVPVLLLSGAEMANFAVAASGWAAQAAERHTTPGLAVAVLFLFLLLRLVSLVSNQFASGWSDLLGWSWAGALILVLGLGLIAWFLRRPLDTTVSQDEVPFGTVVLLAIAFALLQIMLIALGRLIVYIVLGVLLVTGDAAQATALSNAAFTWTLSLSTAYARYAVLIQAALGVLIALAAFINHRRTGGPHRWLLVVFGLVLAWTQSWRWLTQMEQPLARLHFEYAHVDAVLLVVLLGVSVGWAITRQLNRDRALRLLGLAVLAALLNQTNFLDNPFSPLFGFATVVLLVVGVAWNVLTSGGRFLNADSAAFPRPSRALMYFGYVMLSVSVANWFVVGHAVEQQTLQSDLTLSGFTLFGLSLAYVVLVRRGRPLVTG